MMHYLLILLIGYLLGCSNMAVYLAAAQNVDLRSGGSGNPGASNALILMGWRAGLLTALASPVANALLFGMPAAAALPAIVLKSVLLAGAAGYAAARFRRASLALLAAVVLFYQAAGTLGEWALTGSFHAAVQDFRIGLPGMLLQIFGGWAFINFIIRK